MRKLAGFLIVLVAVLFLGMAYSQLAHAADPECDSVLAKKIVELHEADQSKILEMQFDLTVMKLAKESLKANTKTVEAYIKKQEALIEKLDDQGIRPRLVDIYRKFGMLNDEEKIESELEKVVTPEEQEKAIVYRKKQADENLKKGAEKIADASYFKAATRFKNRDLSAYVLAHAQTEEGKKNFDLNDASILWLQAQVSEGVENRTFRGSAAANMTEASTLVARLTGVAGTTGKSLAELELDIKVQEEIIREEFDSIITTFDDAQKKACAVLAVCTDCSEDEKQRAIDTKSAGLNKAVTAIMMGLQADEAKRDAKVSKVITDLSTVEIKRDPTEVAAAKILAKEPKFHPILLDEVVIIGSKKVSEKVKKNTDALLLKIKSKKKVRVKLGNKKYDRYGKCRGSYQIKFVDGVKTVKFQVDSANGVRACESSYTVPLIFTDEGSWDATRIHSACLKGKNGVDVKRVCTEAGR